LPVKLEVFDSHTLKDRCVLFIGLSLHIDRIPIFISGSKSKGFKRDAEAICMLLVRLLETNVDVFDLELEVIQNLFTELIQHAILFFRILYFID
jgi:hypothetical protein